MTINKTAYETTACIGFKHAIDKTIEALKAAYFTGGIEHIPSYNICCLIGGNAESNAVPAFSHPISIDIEGVNRTFIDIRSLGKIDTNSNQFKVRNETEYNLLVARAKLNHIWINENPNWIRDVSPVPMALFASWISEAVAKRFALDPREQFTLAILAAVFYSSQFSDAVEIDEKDKLRITTSVTKALRASAQDVLEIVDKVQVISNVFELCSKAADVTGSIRLKELNTGVLFAILGGTWFGINAKEMIAISVEHPPTWLAIMLSAYTERTYKNSQIARITERSSFSKSGDEFVSATMNLLRVVENK